MDDLVSITTQNIHKIVRLRVSVLNYGPILNQVKGFCLHIILTPLHLETKFKL